MHVVKIINFILSDLKIITFQAVIMESAAALLSSLVFWIILCDF